MDAAWIGTAVTVMTLLLMLWRDAKSAGKREQQADNFDRRLESHGRQIDELYGSVGELGRDVAVLKARDAQGGD